MGYSNWSIENKEKIKYSFFNNLSNENNLSKLRKGTVFFKCWGIPKYDFLISPINVTFFQKRNFFWRFIYLQK